MSALSLITKGSGTLPKTQLEGCSGGPQLQAPTVITALHPLWYLPHSRISCNQLGLLQRDDSAVCVDGLVRVVLPNLKIHQCRSPKPKKKSEYQGFVFQSQPMCFSY